MRAHVEVDHAECQGTGYCVRVCPNVFEMDTVRQAARVRLPVVGPDLLDAVEEAETLCPTGAISVVRDSSR
ncbi:MAG: hypothetical protein QOF45_634 [Gaiellaceae bacterium]|jgi:ferredoxin|nr:hypothetical protein [Gaiellaceae bacterium]